MNTEFKEGDLVLVRRSEPYQVGDIVLYKNSTLGTVFHRIIGSTGSSFFLKGDNNSWVDSYQPTVKEIYGKLWIHLPNIGSLLMSVRKPKIFSLLITFSLIIFGFSIVQDQKIFFSTQSSKGNHDRSTNIGKFTMTYKQTDWFYFILLLLLIEVILAFISFSKPITQETTSNIEYENKGSFDYFAITSDAVYKEGYLESGDKVFRLLTDSINIVFQYQLAIEQPVLAYGTYHVVVEVSDASGWSYPIELVPATDFTGTNFSVSSVLELNQVQQVIDNLEDQTGIINSTYYLTLHPEIDLQGTVSQEQFEIDWSPSLTFLIDDLSMRLSNQNKDTLADLLNPSDGGTIPETKVVGNTISIFGIHLNILILRIASVYGIIFTILLLIWFNKKYSNMQNSNSISMLKAQYGISFVDIKNDFLPSQQKIEIPNMEELAQIAGDEGSRIYHYDQDGVDHYYAVAHNNADLLYHYQVEHKNTDQEKQPSQESHDDKDS